VPLVANKAIPVTLPVTLRAEMRDQNRERLEEQKAKGSLPAGTSFVDPKPGCKPGRAFAYSNARVGRTDWTVKEDLKWELRFDSQDFVKGFAMKSSDACATNDIVEVHPKSGSTQRLVLGLSGKTVWKRQSVLNNKPKEEDVTPADGQLEAEVVISTLPK